MVHGNIQIFIVPLTEYSFNFPELVFVEGLPLFPDGQSTFLLLFSSTIEKVPDPLD